MVGVRVVIWDARTLDDVGVCTAPAPVERPGDLLCLEQGRRLRVVDVLPLEPGAKVVPVLARPAVFAITALRPTEARPASHRSTQIALPDAM